ncbi:putative SWEET sugar transporter [Rosa chinensis]|uniref:Putative SWEET sugar transporter n=1 Tax=Rosa chinensis TaxID=74649 RepID=A0A2P6QY89_ROSCH|nr:bidirectional sugar transporter SWEET16 [Rosa chinensis]PRQ39167.1 putative SWEET sugar transporter [Rosa chinensis]
MKLFALCSSKYPKTPTKAVTLPWFCGLDLGIPLAILLIARRVVDLDDRTSTFGSVAALLNVASFYWPIVELKTMIVNPVLDLDNILLWNGFICCFNGGAWALYGWYVEDLYILVPNCLGMILGCFEVLTFCIQRHRLQQPATLLAEPLLPGWEAVTGEGPPDS